MQIEAHMRGKTVALDVKPSDTIESVKMQIQAKEGVDAGIIRLVYGGKDLADDSTVSDCGIKAGESMLVVFRRTPDDPKVREDVDDADVDDV